MTESQEILPWVNVRRDNWIRLRVDPSAFEHILMRDDDLAPWLQGHECGSFSSRTGAVCFSTAAAISGAFFRSPSRFNSPSLNIRYHS